MNVVGISVLKVATDVMSPFWRTTFMETSSFSCERSTLEAVVRCDRNSAVPSFWAISTWPSEVSVWIAL